MITAEMLREALEYHPDAGIFTWARSGNGISVGLPAGSSDGKGYLRIYVNGRRYAAHRLAWLWAYGEWPTGIIDHINGDRIDNRICNLRVATLAQNQFNSGRNRKNTSGFKGVSWHSRDRQWRAAIRNGGKTVYLGHFNNPEDAHAAYCTAATKLRGDFARFE